MTKMKTMVAMASSGRWLIVGDDEDGGGIGGDDEEGNNQLKAVADEGQ